MTQILVLSLTDIQASRLRSIAEFEGECPENMLKTLIARGHHRYEQEVDEVMAEIEAARACARCGCMDGEGWQ
ncbi:MAG: hypothetical protein AAFU69_07940 [Pseudomonadota bacterium]